MRSTTAEAEMAFSLPMARRFKVLLSRFSQQGFLSEENFENKNFVSKIMKLISKMLHCFQSHDFINLINIIFSLIRK